VTLDAEDIDAVAARVVELLREQPAEPRRYLDAATLARALSVERAWVYLRARELGALRLGDGPEGAASLRPRARPRGACGDTRARPASPRQAPASPSRAPAQAGHAAGRRAHPGEG